jgi:hypothetical protein
MRNCNLPPENEILARIFNTPAKIKRLTDEVLGCNVTHTHKLLRGAARSDLARVCAMITLAASFPDESWEQEGANLQRAGLLADYPREHYSIIQEQAAPAYANEHERVLDSMQILQEAKEAVEAIALGKPTADAIKELVELRDIAEKAITRLSADSGAIK